jgi:hypothetical protein
MPQMLELVDGRVMVAMTEQYQPGRGLALFGGGLFLHARFRETTGNYPIITFFSADEAVCSNREELGSPALICDPGEMTFHGNTLAARLTRHEDSMINASMFLEVDAAPELCMQVEREPLLYYKKIPNGEPGSKPLREVVVLQPDATAEVKERNSGRASVSLGVTVWNFHQVGPLEILGASFTRSEGGSRGTARVVWAN